MKNGHRVALIEIGSRSIRYLVAEISEHEVFKAVNNNAIRHGLDAAAANDEVINGLNTKVAAFTADAQSYGCDKIFCYGTEICRRLTESHPGALMHEIRVLTPREEAMGAWAAGILCEQDKQQFVDRAVIDVGNGSTEIARGIWDNDKIKDFRSIHVSIGSAELIRLFSSDFEEYLVQLKTISELIKSDIVDNGLNRPESCLVYTSGGAATKLAWLSARRSLEEIYKPYRINGHKVSFGALNQSYLDLRELFNRSPSEAAAFVDHRYGSEDEVVRVLACTPFLTLLNMGMGNTDDIVFSGYGLRHGLAYLLGKSILA